jgi:cob(I)alamin adenosyltransferase
MGQVMERTAASAIDVNGYRERVAGAVGLGVTELVGSNRNDPRAAMLRMVAAYLLLQGDRLAVGDVARIMDKSEQWVRDSTDYIERRMTGYHAFRIYIEKTIATYALASSSRQYARTHCRQGDRGVKSLGVGDR